MTDPAAEINDRKTRSLDWLKDNFYPEWEGVYKAYKCLRDPELDPDGKPDPDATSVGLPMTFSHVRRNVARATAQIPNLKFRSKDPDLSQLIGRTLMYQWDRGGIQRQQKRHMTQALMFGISIRAWYWGVDEFTRSKRVDPLDPNITPETLQQIAEMYGIPLKYLTHPEVGMLVRAKLMTRAGRGGLLPVRYPYTSYVGPKCEFLFLGDCYFQPNFQSLQTSQWFIVERRRDLAWMKRVAKRFPEFAPGFDKLLQQCPQGTPRPTSSRDAQNLRERMMSAIGQVDNTVAAENDTREWTITEQHVPGADASLTYVGDGNVYIGKIPYPYDLDGQIAFTELILIDELLSGIGDSTARIIQGLQQLHDRQTNTRMALIYNLLRPLVGTTNQELLENPKLIKRYSGMRLVKMRGPNDMWVQGEQAAMASAAAGLQDESAIMRLYQLASGESNMSMNAQVDPQQARTATGARLMAYNQDVLTKDLVDMFNETSVKADAEMMFLLNRSELGEKIEFDGAIYNREYNSGVSQLQAQWMAAEPIDFQQDGEITAEVGSTLADDDEARVAKATTLWQQALTRPDLINPMKARDEMLIAMGKGKELAQWAAPPPPPPPPPEIRASLTVAAKWEMLSQDERNEFMTRAGIQVQVEGGPPGPGAPGPGGPPQSPDGSSEGPLVGASALAAAKGHSPFTEGMPT